MGFFKNVAKFIGVSYLLFAAVVTLLITVALCYAIYRVLSEKTGLNEPSKISIAVFSGIFIFILLFAPTTLGLTGTLIDFS